jgi:serine protease Do
MEGKLIGITTAIKTRSGSFQGVGLAISSNLARDIMKKLQRDGVIRRGWLGVQIMDAADPGVAERLGLRRGQTGVVVTRVLEESPGAKGGLRQNDVITALGDRAISDGRDLQRVVGDLAVGKSVRVTILREGKPAALDVVIEEQPEQ